MFPKTINGPSFFDNSHRSICKKSAWIRSILPFSLKKDDIILHTRPSFSTAMSFLQVSAKASVITPNPAPISRIVLSRVNGRALIILSRILLSSRKFWPSFLFGRNPCSLHNTFRESVEDFGDIVVRFR